MNCESKKSSPSSSAMCDAVGGEKAERDIVERLRDTPNWRRESFGHWKSMTSQYDRAPFEAADEIERLRAALAAASSMGAWQPIETAPRDGTRFLATDGNVVRLVRWADKYDRLPIGDESGGVWPDLPYHWTPLPAAPGSAAPVSSPSIAPVGEATSDTEMLDWIEAYIRRHGRMPEFHPDNPDLRTALARSMGRDVRAPMGEEAKPAEPFWHAVVSERAPVIDKAIRRADVADEYAQKCRNDGYTDAEVVPLYRASPSPAVPLAAPLTEEALDDAVRLIESLGGNPKLQRRALREVRAALSAGGEQA